MGRRLGSLRQPLAAPCADVDHLAKAPAPAEAFQMTPEEDVVKELLKLIKPTYEPEFRQRMRLMRENESMSRECVEIEIEIREHQTKHEKLTETVTSLRGRRDELQKRVDGLTSNRSSLASEIENLSASKKALEDELVRLRKKHRGHVTAIEKFQGQRKRLVA